MIAAPANAQTITGLSERIVSFAEDVLPSGQEEVAALALIFGILAFAIFVALMWSRAQSQLNRLKRESAEETLAVGAERDALLGLIRSAYPILIRWRPGSDRPEVDCAATPGSKLPATREAVLAFGNWLEPSSAQEFEAALAALRQDGAAFSLMLSTRGGNPVQADGHASGALTAVRFRDLADSERTHALVSDAYRTLRRDAAAMQSVLDAVPLPAWLADAEGRPSWVNAAYADAVGASDPTDAVERGLRLFAPEAQAAIAGAVAAQGSFSGELAGVGAEARYLVQASAENGAVAGIAIDRSAQARELAGRDAEIAGHLHTLGALKTAVAHFGPDMRLRYANTAVRGVWQLDSDWLDTGPDAGDILDALRSSRRLPDEANWREWKAAFLKVPEKPREELWRLPDGQKLRAVADPAPDGGVTYLFDDVTERLALQSRYEALSELQRETLDGLSEAIAVFGSNGRLKLTNPAMQELWELSDDSVASMPRIEQWIGWCAELHPDEEAWNALRATATSVEDRRQTLNQRLARRDGRVLDMSALPLPDGSTLVVFVDMTDSARVEKALRNANEALTHAAQIKNDFVRKVSYELRVPLTTIIGYAELLAEGASGLNERQRGQLTDILSSGEALRAIVNDILDLATIDAGVMSLDIGEIDAPAIIEQAAGGLRDRIREASIELAVSVDEPLGAFRADPARLRQVLFNVLSNAVGFSPQGGTVSIACRGEPGHVVFEIADQGPGVPEERRDTVFDRFESFTGGTGHRGAGLGLAIVRSLVILHGGSVKIATADGGGALVVCRFPREPRQPAVEDFEAPGAAPEAAATKSADAAVS
ncbi:MAG: ATP-binding protein [Flavobacteriaceae bacterium]